MARIISTQPGGGSHSGQTMALQQAQQIRGARGWGGTGRRGEGKEGTGRNGGEGKEMAAHDPTSPPADPPAGRERDNGKEERVV